MNHSNESHQPRKMIAADSDGETSSRETTGSISQENQNQYHLQNDENITFNPHSDLKLWLQHTGFFDIEHRQKVLGAIRKLKAIDEQRSKILDEICTCTECYPSSSSASTVPHSPSVLESFSPSFSVVRKTGYVDYNALLGSQSAASASSGEHCSSEVSLMNNGAGSDSCSITFGNRPTSSQQDVQNAQPSIEATTSLDDPDYESQEAESPPSCDTPSEIESYRFSKGRAMRNYTPSQILSLAPKQESRYFLVKSFNIKNVDMSQRDGLWITSANNGALFASAFQHHKSVFLIFSVNKSKAFQGYARMITLPTAAIPPAKWMSNISWAASYPFRIQWLNTHRTEFWKLGDLKNHLNDGKPVFVGRDGQEFPEACGRKMISVMDRGDARGCAGAPSWMTRNGYGHADKEDETPTWRHDESSEAKEVVSANAEPQPVDDMPLIKY